MKEKTFHFEIKDSVIQFISAFDDVVISRYNKQREEQHRLKVRYMYAPKQRVVHDLTNKNKHITLPVIAVSIASVSRDTERVFNKIHGSYHTRKDLFAGEEMTTKTDHLKSPVPININVNMSILTKYQSDMDQILSNFIPHSNPYVVISWKTPEGLLQTPQELRSQVLWDENINLSYPDNLSANQQYRISADTTFTIKSWLFKTKDDPAGNIFKITTNFTPVIDIE